MEENEVTQRAFDDFLKHGAPQTRSTGDSESIFQDLTLPKHYVLVISSPVTESSRKEGCSRTDASIFRALSGALRGDVEASEEPSRAGPDFDNALVGPSGERTGNAPSSNTLPASAPPSQKRIRFGDVEIDVEHRYVRRSGHILKMTRSEYELLLFFVRNVDQAITRDVLLNKVWGYECYPTTRTVDTHIVKLRKKLEPDPRVPRYLLTIHGVGYRFVMFPAIPFTSNSTPEVNFSPT